MSKDEIEFYMELDEWAEISGNIKMDVNIFVSNNPDATTDEVNKYEEKLRNKALLDMRKTYYKDFIRLSKPFSQNPLSKPSRKPSVSGEEAEKQKQQKALSAEELEQKKITLNHNLSNAKAIVGDLITTFKKKNPNYKLTGFDNYNEKYLASTTSDINNKLEDDINNIISIFEKDKQKLKDLSDKFANSFKAGFDIYLSSGKYQQDNLPLNESFNYALKIQKIYTRLLSNTNLITPAIYAKHPIIKENYLKTVIDYFDPDTKIEQARTIILHTMLDNDKNVSISNAANFASSLQIMVKQITDSIDSYIIDFKKILAKVDKVKKYFNELERLEMKASGFAQQYFYQPQVKYARLNR